MNRPKHEIHRPEWDFRSIPPVELDDAIFYEYGREQGRAVKLFADWHQQTLKGSRIRGVTVRHFLEKVESNLEIRPELETAYLAIRQPWHAAHSKEADSPELERLFEICPLFPTPYSTINPTRWKSYRAEEKGPAFTILRQMPTLSPANRDRLERQGVCYVALKMSFRAGLTEVLEQSNQFVREKYDQLRTLVGKERAARFRKKTGGGPSERWTWLKDLAAFRLDRSGKDRKEAEMFLSNETGVTERPHLVLPFYNGASSWSEAVGRAKQRIGEWPFFK